MAANNFKTEKTTCILSICNNDKVNILFQTIDNDKMNEYIRDNYPNAIELKNCSEVRRNFDFVNTPYLHLVITPLYKHSYIYTYSF